MNPPPRQDAASVENVRVGQKFLIYAILLNIGTLPLRFGTHDVALLAVSGTVALASIAVSIMGILKVSGGLGYGVGWRMAFCVFIILPLISLIVLLMLNGKATNYLRTAGYQVGLLGAKRKEP